MKTINAVALSFLLVFGGLLTSIPQASSDPGHAKFILPPVALPGVTRLLGESAPAAGVPLGAGTVAVSLWAVVDDTDADLAVVTGSSAGCIASLFGNPDLAMPGATDKLWVLSTAGAGDSPTTTGTHGSIVPSTITVDPTFGDGGSHTLSIVPPAGSGSVIPVGLQNWEEYGDTNPGAGITIGVIGEGTDAFAIAAPSLKHFVNCADFLVATGGILPGTVDETFIVIEPDVGGELMPRSTTSLLVAGAQINALWILPILGLVGTIIAIRKLES